MSARATKSSYGISRATARTATLGLSGVPLLETGGTESELAQTVNDLNNVAGTSQYWAYTDWYVDETVGNDANTGLSGAPLATFAELWRRIRNSPTKIVTTVHVTSATISATNPPRVGVLPPGSQITFVNNFTTTNVGVITAVQARTPANNQALEIEISGLSGTWTPYVGKIVRLVSTDPTRNGSIAVVTKDLGTINKRARLATFLKPRTNGNTSYASSQLKTPVAGDSIEVITSGCTLLTNPNIATLSGLANNSFVEFQYFDFNEDYAYVNYPVSGNTNLLGCRIRSMLLGAGTAFLNMTCCAVGGAENYEQVGAYDLCKLSFNASAVLSTAYIGAWSIGTLITVGDSVLQGGASYASINLADGVSGKFSNIGIFDNTASPSIDIGDVCSAVFSNYLFGTGNTGIMVTMGTLTRASYANKAFFVATTSAAAPASMGATTFAFTALPFTASGAGQNGAAWYAG